MAATIPVGILGVVFEHQFRVLFAKPLAAAIFLMANGLILVAGELYRRRGARLDVGALPDASPAGSRSHAPGHRQPQTARRAAVPFSRRTHRPHGRRRRTRPVADRPAELVLIGAAQALALLAGISREGVAMVGGLFRGLSNENAMRFSFLLSTPVIFAAGMLKVPDLTGPLGAGIRGPVLAGSLAAAAASLFAIVFLSRYFRTRTLLPFAVYSLLFGLASVVRFGIF